MPRPGFDYPPRGVHHLSYRHGTCRSVHGLHPSRLTPRPRLVLLSEPVLSWRSLRSRRPAPEGTWRQGTGSSSEPSSRGESVLSPRPLRVLAVDAFLGFSPPELVPNLPGQRIEYVASPHALRAARRRCSHGPQGLGVGRGERSVSGSTALMGFSTFQRHSAPYAGPRRACSWFRLTWRRWGRLATI